MYDIIFLGQNEAEWQKFKEHYPNAHRLPADSSWADLKKQAFTKMFWVVWDNLVFDHTFDLNKYRADQWDDMYVHIFKNGNTYDGVCLFPKSLNPSTVEFKHRFFIKRKEIDQIISNPQKRDESFEVVFISYQEPNAEKNYRSLKQKVPDAHRIHGIKGIHRAHIEAAKLVKSDMFYVVDGDAEIVDGFNFNHNIDLFERDTVYVWKSKNPINDLEYGYGGVKLLPRNKTLDLDINSADMTTSISKKFKSIDEISNITAFNTDPFNTWKSAFRECVKLSSKIIQGQDNEETEQRLQAWTTQGKTRRFGDSAIRGARFGSTFGSDNRNNLTELSRINDFDWLKEKFEEDHER